MRPARHRVGRRASRPAPVLVILLGFAQTTGHGDLRTSLAILSGSGLGASIGALLAIPSGPRGRRLAQLHLSWER